MGNEMTSAQKKYYAIVPMKGDSHVHFKTWNEVEPLIKGLSLFAQKCFKSREDANTWVVEAEAKRAFESVQNKAKAKAKNIGAKNDLSRSEIIASQTNSVHWNAQRKLKKRISES